MPVGIQIAAVPKKDENILYIMKILEDKLRFREKNICPVLTDNLQKKAWTLLIGMAHDFHYFNFINLMSLIKLHFSELKMKEMRKK